MKRLASHKVLSVMVLASAASATSQEINQPATAISGSMDAMAKALEQAPEVRDVLSRRGKKVEVISSDQIKEVPVEHSDTKEDLERNEKLRAQQEFDALWQSSVKDEFAESDVTGNIDVQDIVEPSTEYRYASFGKRDPFVAPLGRFKVFSPLSTTDNRYEIPVVNSLQRPLDQLSVTGIWQTQDADFRALIRISGQRTASLPTASDEAVVAKVGDPIGPAGKISKITPDTVETRQYTIEQDGTRKYEDVALYLGNPLERNLDAEKRTIILGPGGEKVIRVESNVAGSAGGVRYLNAVTGQDITQMYQSDKEKLNRKKIGL